MKERKNNQLKQLLCQGSTTGQQKRACSWFNKWVNIKFNWLVSLCFMFGKLGMAWKKSCNLPRQVKTNKLFLFFQKASHQSTLTKKEKQFEIHVAEFEITRSHWIQKLKWWYTKPFYWPELEKNIWDRSSLQYKIELQGKAEIVVFQFVVISW